MRITMFGSFHLHCALKLPGLHGTKVNSADLNKCYQALRDCVPLLVFMAYSFLPVRLDTAYARQSPGAR